MKRWTRSLGLVSVALLLTGIATIPAQADTTVGTMYCQFNQTSIQPPVAHPNVSATLTASPATVAPGAFITLTADVSGLTNIVAGPVALPVGAARFDFVVGLPSGGTQVLSAPPNTVAIAAFQPVVLPSSATGGVVAPASPGPATYVLQDIVMNQLAAVGLSDGINDIFDIRCNRSPTPVTAPTANTSSTVMVSGGTGSPMYCQLNNTALQASPTTFPNVGATLTVTPAVALPGSLVTVNASVTNLNIQNGPVPLAAGSVRLDFVIGLPSGGTASVATPANAVAIAPAATTGLATSATGSLPAGVVTGSATYVLRDVVVNFLDLAGGGSTSGTTDPFDMRCNRSAQPVNAPAPITSTTITVGGASAAIVQVAGQQPGVAAIRRAPVDPQPVITVSGSNWPTALPAGQITAQVCTLGFVCLGGAPVATSLITDLSGQLSGVVQLPGTSLSSSGLMKLRLAYGPIEAFVDLTVLGTPSLVGTPLFGPVGTSVALSAANLNPLQPVEIAACSESIGSPTCTVVGTAPAQTASANGTLIFPSFTVTDSSTRRIQIYQPGAGPSSSWPTASTSFSVLVTTPQLGLSVPAGVSYPADGVSANVLVGNLSPSASGDVEVSVFGPGDLTCSAPPVASESSSISVVAAGQATAEVVLPLGSTGTYRWRASFSGEPALGPVTTSCDEPGTTTLVSPLAGDLDAQVDSAQVVLGDPSSVSATLSGVDASAVGTVEFAMYAGSVCTGVPVDTASVPVSGSGSYSSSAFTPTLIGPYVWQVSYSGDANHTAIGPVCDTANASFVIVGEPQTPTKLQAAPYLLPSGDPINGHVRLSWVEPTDTGGLPIDWYVLRFYDAGTNNLRTTEFILGGYSQVAFAGYAPMDDFDVTIAAQNAVGESPESARVFMQPNRTPLAPVITGASSSASGSVTVKWTPGPTTWNDQTYRLTLQPGGLVVTMPANTGESSYTFTGLTNGQPYTVEVVAVPPATNIVGLEESAPAMSPPVTPFGLPAQPTSVTAEPRLNAIRVAWSPPAETGGSPITNYLVRNLTTNAVRTVSGTTTAVTIGSLTPGTQYAFTVTARTAIGDSPASIPTPLLSPAAGAPSTPGTPGATAGPGRAEVSWTAPADDGGAVIEAYQVRSTNTSTSTTITRTRNDTAIAYSFTGLTNGQTYTFEVRARNAANLWGPWSSAPNAVTPATIPSAPTTVVGTAYRAAAQVTWAPPTSNGGSPVTSYLVSLSIGTGPVLQQATVSAAGPLQASFIGLTNGTTYRINVKATNSVGTSTNTGYVSVRPTATRPALP